MFRLMEPPKEVPARVAFDAASRGLTPDVDFTSVLHTLMRRRSVILGIFLTFLGLVVFFTLVIPKKYQATVTLIAGSTEGATLGQGVGTEGTAVSSIPILNALLAIGGGQSPETYVALLQERPVAAAVISQLHLNIGPRELLNHVSVQPITGTAMLTLTSTWSDPQTAARIANSFANVFVERERDLVSGQAGSALQFLAKQIPVAEANLRQTSAKLAAYEAAHSLVDVNDQTQAKINVVSNIESSIAQVEVDQRQAQAQLASVDGQIQSMSSTIEGSITTGRNPILSELQDQLTQVDVQLQAALNRYTTDHPQVISLQAQKTELESEIANQRQTVTLTNNTVPNPLFQQLDQQDAALHAQVAGDEARVSLLRNQLLSASSVLKRLPVEVLKLADLKRDASLAESVYNALQQKQNEAIVSRTTSLSDVAVTEPASADDVVVKPNWRVNLMVGMIVALVLAVSGAFVIDFFDSTINGEKAAEQLGLPILTTIPRVTDQNRVALPWLKAVTIESFIMLVTTLRYSSSTPVRSFAMTSPMQGDGKSTVALNTAVAMAEVQPKVLIVDGDMRQPTLHDKLRLPNRVGLSDVLVGATTLASATQPTRFHGLYFLSAGSLPPNPLRLLQSARLPALVDEILATYKAVVFDTPALAGILDALVIAAQVDGALLVASAGRTDLRAARRAMYLLENTDKVTLLGLILNQTEVMRRDGAYSNYCVDGLAQLPLTGGSDAAEQTEARATVQAESPYAGSPYAETPYAEILSHDYYADRLARLSLAAGSDAAEQRGASPNGQSESS